MDIPTEFSPVSMEIDDEIAKRHTDRLQREPGLGHPSTASLAVPSRLDLALTTDPVAGEFLDRPEDIVHVLWIKAGSISRRLFRRDPPISTLGLIPDRGDQATRQA
jgi:hypothetical protein